LIAAVLLGITGTALSASICASCSDDRDCQTIFGCRKNALLKKGFVPSLSAEQQAWMLAEMQAELYLGATAQLVSQHVTDQETAADMYMIT